LAFRVLIELSDDCSSVHRARNSEQSSWSHSEASTIINAFVDKVLADAIAANYSVEFLEGTVNFGEYLKSLRTRRGLSLREVQSQTEVSNSFISQVERGVRWPSIDVVMKLARVYGVPADQLIQARKHDGQRESKSAQTGFESYEDAYWAVVKA